MKNLNLISNNTSTFYIGKWGPNYNVQESLALIGIQKSFSNQKQKIVLKPLIRETFLYQKILIV